jgi:hypothetical protein
MYGSINFNNALLRRKVTETIKDNKMYSQYSECQIPYNVNIIGLTVNEVVLLIHVAT